MHWGGGGGGGIQWWIQDFPDGGEYPNFFGNNLLFGKTFAGNCIKMKKIELGDGVFLAPPPFPPPMALHDIEVDLPTEGQEFISDYSLIRTVDGFQLVQHTVHIV